MGWINCPKYLLKAECGWLITSVDTEITVDAEVKRSIIINAVITEDTLKHSNIDQSLF